MFDTVLIAGLGLMGGSMAKTIKARTLSRVLGWNRTRATAEQALADGSIDAIATEALYKEADLVIIGLYPQATVDWLLENMPKMKKGCVIVDMVGVKQLWSIIWNRRRLTPVCTTSAVTRWRAVSSPVWIIRCRPCLTVRA